MSASLALFLPDLPMGGVELVTANLAKGLADLGHRPTLVFGDADGPGRRHLPAGVPVVDLEVRRTREAIRPLAAHLRDGKYDALISSKEHANVAAAAAVSLSRTDTRLIVVAHLPPGLSASEGLHLAGRRPRRLVRWAYERADGVVAVSYGVADAVANDLHLDRRSISVIRNPVLDGLLAPRAELPPADRLPGPEVTWFEDDGADTILWVGRLTDQKNLPLLLCAVATVNRDRALRLVVVGEGPERSALQAEAIRLGLPPTIVAFVGSLAEPGAVMARARALVLSSRWEGLPTVLIEALAAGCPIVSTDCPAGPREILEDGRLGRLVPVADAAALASAIVDTLDDPLGPATEADLAAYQLPRAAASYLDVALPGRRLAGEKRLDVDLLVVGHDRPDEVASAFASAEGFDFAGRLLFDNGSSPALAVPDRVVGSRSDTNLGVTGARNRIAKGADADLLVYLDDDAVFLSDPVPEVRQAFDADPRLGAVAFSVRRPDGSIESSEWPFRGPPRDPDLARPCAYFVGAGYAVRRSALDDVGGYDERYFYSTEEIDLSMRLIAARWTLAYVPSVRVEHRPASTGRTIRPAVPGLRLRNRLQYARSHLPLPIAIVHSAVWIARTFREARSTSSLGLWSSGLRYGITSPVPRQPLAWRSLLDVHRRGGRIWW